MRYLHDPGAVMKKLFKKLKKNKTLPPPLIDLYTMGFKTEAGWIIQMNDQGELSLYNDRGELALCMGDNDSVQLYRLLLYVWGKA